MELSVSNKKLEITWPALLMLASQEDLCFNGVTYSCSEVLLIFDVYIYFAVNQSATYQQIKKAS
jgi:hypothetical protein